MSGDFVIRIRCEDSDFGWVGFVVIEVAELEFREVFKGQVGIRWGPVDSAHSFFITELLSPILKSLLACIKDENEYGFRGMK